MIGAELFTVTLRYRKFQITPCLIITLWTGKCLTWRQGELVLEAISEVRSH